MKRATPVLALLALLAAPLAAAAQARPQRTAQEREAKARAYFTNTVLLDQDGREVRFYDDVLRGQVVVLSFIFTRCVEACPLIAQKLNVIRRELGERFGRDVRFVSISVDPDFDTPEELRHFAGKQKAAHPGWTFLTGRKENVQAVLRKLGEYVENPGDHTTAFLGGNVRTGHWTKIRPDAPPVTIADTMRRLADEPAEGGGAVAASPAGPGR
jgi:cytochrome oxidase Cu insertion factor (SCO1/SenC/PrrC family)